MRIFLSPSSQYQNQYTGANTNEAAVCRHIARQAKPLLEAAGHTVFLSEADSLSDRIASSNAKSVDYHLCIHTNAGGGDGTLVMCWDGNQNDPYVQAVYNHVAALSPGKDDGIRTSTVAEIKKTKAKCIYLECEFHDREDLAGWLISHTEAIAQAIASAFGYNGLSQELSNGSIDGNNCTCNCKCK